MTGAEKLRKMLDSRRLKGELARWRKAELVERHAPTEPVSGWDYVLELIDWFDQHAEEFAADRVPVEPAPELPGEAEVRLEAERATVFDPDTVAANRNRGETLRQADKRMQVEYRIQSAAEGQSIPADAPPPEDIAPLLHSGEAYGAARERLFGLYNELTNKMMLGLATDEDRALQSRLHNGLAWISRKGVEVPGAV